MRWNGERYRPAQRYKPQSISFQKNGVWYDERPKPVTKPISSEEFSMEHFIYRGAKTSQISFPLGGIGSGSIGLAGNGRLVDWEIFNRPNKGSVNGFSHFALRAEDGERVLAARILHADLQPPYQGELTGALYSSFGSGPRREY